MAKCPKCGKELAVRNNAYVCLDCGYQSYSSVSSEQTMYVVKSAEEIENMTRKTNEDTESKTVTAQKETKQVPTKDKQKAVARFNQHERLHEPSNVIRYVKFSTGAIELHKNYVVFYNNLYPFQRAVNGRNSTVISFDDIVSITYKGCGWYPGYYIIKLKHQHTFRFLLFKWFVWGRKKVNNDLRSIYGYIFGKVQKSWIENATK